MLRGFADEPMILVAASPDKVRWPMARDPQNESGFLWDKCLRWS